MDIDLELRRVRIGIGEFADFTIGPRGGAAGAGSGPWRAQLGVEWHRRLRDSVPEDSGARFEVPIAGSIVRRGWTIALTGRIDQIFRSADRLVLREIKTVSRALPEDPAILRAAYPDYFLQLAAYAALAGTPEGRSQLGTHPPSGASAELVFVEVSSGLSQTVALSPQDAEALWRQAEALAEFLDLRLQARERRRQVRFRPPFPALRPGQESAGADLATAFAEGARAVLLQAPTGFGKTGVLLQFALTELRAGRFDRLLYLTGKATGQLQVAATLAAMADPGAGGGPAAWHVRNKAEHCVNAVFHCVREACPYLDGAEERWADSGLSRFFLLENRVAGVEELREAGRAASICPYEITRAALAFNDVWIGDYNYVFSPANRALFYEQPDFQPGRALLIVDEAHNLPGRVAGAYSGAFTADEAAEVCGALDRTAAPPALAAAWDRWRRYLESLAAVRELAWEDGEEARGLLGRMADALERAPLDFAALGPRVCDFLWRVPALAEQWGASGLPYLCWCPRPGELALTCLDAAAAIGASLAEFCGAVLSTATPGPVEAFSGACGLPLRKVDASAPWRDGAYDVAVDLRVSTAFQQRGGHYPTTAATVAALCRRSREGGTRGPVAVFFPSYAYAQAVAREAESEPDDLRIAIQPRLTGLAPQAEWVETALDSADALFLILGSSFAESIDLLGGRVFYAMVAGPALPEVDAVQHARLSAMEEKVGREAAFDRVYRIAGMQKVNQALGRLVRAPGQGAKVLLHCKRFAEPAYGRLLDPEYRTTARIRSEADLAAWLDAEGCASPLDD